MKFVHHSLLLVALSFVPNFCVAALTFGFPYGTTKVRGVNLGGWLVLEVISQMRQRNSFFVCSKSDTSIYQ